LIDDHQQSGLARFGKSSRLPGGGKPLLDWPRGLSRSLAQQPA
jgi:hypothetical protein